MINPSGRPDKFIPDDRFGETIIKLNKEKVRPSANAKTDEFLREVVAPNVLTLWKSKKVMAKVVKATDHGNRHKVVNSFHDVTFVVNLLLLESVFEEKPGRGFGNDEESVSTDLYENGATTLASGIPLRNYKLQARGNWEKSHRTYDEEQALFEEGTDEAVEHVLDNNDGED